MIQEIPYQPITFDLKTCGDYCLTLANNYICGDYVTNPTMMGNPITDWTIVKGTQFLERSFLSNGAGAVTLSQSVSIPAGDYKLFYNFSCANNFDFELTITNGPSAVTVFDTALGDAPGGVYEFTLTGASARTLTIALDEVLSGNIIGTNYVYICEDTAITPENDFCFQLPLINEGTELLGDSTVDLDASFADTDTSQPSFSGSSTCLGAYSAVWDNLHLDFTANEDGFYFFKYEIDSGSVTYSTIGGLAHTIRLAYVLDAGSGTAYVDFDSNSLSGGFKSQTELLPAAGGACNPTDCTEVQLVGQYEDDGSGTCYITYDLGDLTTTVWPMWQEDTFTATDDTFYRLKFKNANTTGTTVKIYDSASVLIFQADSDGVIFDKIFDTGTLPVDKTITIRYEFDEFLDTDSATWYNDILTEATLYEQCKYDVSIETTAEVFVANLTETHATTTEGMSTLSYNKTIEYCQDINELVPGTYQLRAVENCDATDLGITSNELFICRGSCDGLKQLTWIPSNKTVGAYTLDYTAYPSTQFMWLKMDLQDLQIEDEREVYRRSDGFYNIPYSINHTTEVLQIWPVPPFARKAIAAAMQDNFFIDGVEYQKIEEDAYAPQFTARHDNAMRITVAKVGDFSISRNV